MLKKIRFWWTEQRRWRDEHVESWEGKTDPDLDGLTPFQRETESRIRETLRARGLELEDCRVYEIDGAGESYILAKVPALRAEVWIYHDQTNITTPGAELRLEEWDARTPKEHYDRVAQFLEALSAEQG